jgi:Domain of unknown function (DUF4168)
MSVYVPVADLRPRRWLAFLLSTCVITGAFAQVQEPAAPPPESVSPIPGELAPVDESKIDQFADAYLAIEQIHVQTATQLKQTPDADAVNDAKAQAETKIIEAVERSGLRLDEFNQIADLMKIDAELRQKIASRVQERRKT